MSFLWAPFQAVGDFLHRYRYPVMAAGAVGAAAGLYYGYKTYGPLMCVVFPSALC
jgi:hypothetical protein